jgi:hypothetical protein
MAVRVMRCKASRTPTILYLVYWGAAEPLGQSIVLPPVRRLSQLGARVTLMTFDKAGDLARRRDMQQIR